jgi:hypothetical protein
MDNIFGKVQNKTELIIVQGKVPPREFLKEPPKDPLKDPPTHQPRNS